MAKTKEEFEALLKQERELALKRLKETNFEAVSFAENILKNRPHIVTICSDSVIKGMKLRGQSSMDADRIQNWIMAGKSVEEIKAMPEASNPEIAAMLDEIILAGQVDREHLAESKQMYADTLNDIHPNIVKGEEIETLIQGQNLPKPNKPKKINKVLVEDEIEKFKSEAVRKLYTPHSADDRTTAYLMNDPSLGENGAFEIAENSYTPEGRVKNAKKFVYDILSVDINKFLNMNDYQILENYSTYSYQSILLFDTHFYGKYEKELEQFLSPEQINQLQTYTSNVYTSTESKLEEFRQNCNPLTQYVDIKKCTVEQLTGLITTGQNPAEQCVASSLETIVDKIDDEYTSDLQKGLDAQASLKKSIGRELLEAQYIKLRDKALDDFFKQNIEISRFINKVARHSKAATVCFDAEREKHKFTSKASESLYRIQNWIMAGKSIEEIKALPEAKNPEIVPVLDDFILAGTVDREHLEETKQMFAERLEKFEPVPVSDADLEEFAKNTGAPKNPNYKNPQNDEFIKQQVAEAKKLALDIFYYPANAHRTVGYLMTDPRLSAEDRFQISENEFSKSTRVKNAEKMFNDVLNFDIQKYMDQTDEEFLQNFRENYYMKYILFDPTFFLQYKEEMSELLEPDAVTKLEKTIEKIYSAANAKAIEFEAKGSKVLDFFDFSNKNVLDMIPYSTGKPVVVSTAINDIIPTIAEAARNTNLLKEGIAELKALAQQFVVNEAGLERNELQAWDKALGITQPTVLNPNYKQPKDKPYVCTNYLKYQTTTTAPSRGLTKTVSQIVDDNLDPDIYANDLANKIWSGKTQTDYNTFCTMFNIPDDQKLTPEQQTERRALAAAMSKAIFKENYDRLISKSFDYELHFAGLSKRQFGAVMFEPGIEHLEENKARLNTFLNGTAEERKKCIEDRLKNLYERGKKVCQGTYTDKQILENYEELSTIGIALGMEWGAFASSCKKAGIELDPTLLNNLNNFNEKAYQYNNYFVGRADYIASAYYQYGGEAQMHKQLDKVLNSIPGKNFELSKSMEGFLHHSTNGAMAMTNELMERIQAGGKEVRDFYTLDGKRFSQEKLRGVLQNREPIQVMTFFKGESVPQLYEFDLSQGFPAKVESKVLTTEVFKQTSAKIFDQKYDAIQKSSMSKAQKEFEVDYMSTQYKLALCLNEKNAQKNSNVRGLMAEYLARTVSKENIKEPKLDKTTANLMMSKELINKVKNDLLKDDQFIDRMFDALPKDIEGIMNISQEETFKALTEVTGQLNKEKLAKKDGPKLEEPKKEEPKKEAPQMGGIGN